ncbi:MAG: hypothetical protein AAB947_00775 [Patescibacteria group bacterium]
MSSKSDIIKWKLISNFLQSWGAVRPRRKHFSCFLLTRKDSLSSSCRKSAGSRARPCMITSQSSRRAIWSGAAILGAVRDFGREAPLTWQTSSRKEQTSLSWRVSRLFARCQKYRDQRAASPKLYTFDGAHAAEAVLRDIIRSREKHMYSF